MQVELWLRKGNKRAAAVMCHQLISHFPESARADQARRWLESMGPEYVSGAVLLSPTDPPKPSLLQRILPLSRQTPQAPAQPEAEAPSADEAAPRSRSTMNPFRRRPAATDDPADDVPPGDAEPYEEAPDMAPETEAPKKRNWLWPIPRLLPSDSELDARKLESAAAEKQSEP